MRAESRVPMCRFLISGYSFLLGVALLRLTGAALAAEETNPAEALNRQMNKLTDDRKFGEALPIAKELLTMAEQTSGPQSTNAAACLKDLGHIYQGMGDRPKAEQAFNGALAILGKAEDPPGLQTAAVLADQGGLYMGMDRLDQAEESLQRASRIQIERLRPADTATNLELATTYSYLGWLFKQQGFYDKSEPFYQKALLIRTNALGMKDRGTAWSFNNLANLYFAAGDYTRAEPLFRQALDIRRANLPPTDAELALSYNDLALFYKTTGVYDKAEEMYRQALAIKEPPVGREDMSLALSLNNLGTFYLGIGAYAKAEPVLLRALQIKQKVLDPQHSSIATSLHNLALVYQGQGDLERALDYCQRATDMTERSRGPDHADTASSLMGLGGIYYQEGDYARAETNYLRALAIERKVLATNHPSTATTLHNLGRLYLAMGDHVRAETLYREALGIREQVLGPHHRDSAKTLENLARLEVESGNKDQARRLCLRAAEANEAVLANILRFTSEKQRLDFRRELDPYSLLGTIGGAQPLLRAVLRNKGLVLDSLLEDRMFGESAKDPQVRELGSQLRSARRRLSQMDTVAPKDTTPEAEQRRAAQKRELDAVVESTEASLARYFAGHGFARRALSVTVEQVQKAIPKKSVLVEFVRYTHFLGKADKKKEEERYGAVLLAEKGEPKWISLGPAKDIEDQVRRFQDLMHGTSGEARLISILGSLYKQVWAPLEPGLPPGSTTVIISPDAELNFLSLALLLDPSGQFLARKYSLRYVACGRDLLLANAKPVSVRRAGIFANPDYGASLGLAATNQPPERLLLSAELRGGRGLKLGPLPGAEREARLLEEKSTKLGFGQAVLRVGKSATESELNALHSLYVLHLATHGFLLPEWGSTGAQGTNGGAGTRLQSQFQLNPMRRSGVALAGAQRTFEAWDKGQTVPPENDGIVTAEEVGGLNLRGTWLVVLSACDTGLGEARAGEGVLGLRRGFVQAGVRNLLLTLWPIDDELTGKIIMDFYTEASRTGDAPRAMAEVQRECLEKLRKEKGLLESCRIAGPFILSFQGEAQ